MLFQKQTLFTVGIATPYKMDGPEIESREARDFSHPSKPALVTCLFPGVKRQGRGVNHPPLSSAEVKERVELFLYSPSGLPRPVLERTLPLPSFTLNTATKSDRICGVEVTYEGMILDAEDGFNARVIFENRILWTNSSR